MDEAALNAAKEEAVSDDAELETVEEEAVDEEVEDVEIEEEVEEEEEIDVEDELPDDHKERSSLGRKISALLKRSDKLEDVLTRQQEMIELLAPKKEADPSDDEYMTKGEFNTLLSQQNEESNRYQNEFKTTFHTLSKGMDDAEKEAVGIILLENYTEPVTSDGKIDGASAFHKAKSHYKKVIKKEIPLKGKKATGVLKKQTQKKTLKSVEKLDKVSESYLNYVRKTRGDEAAEKLRKA